MSVSEKSQLEFFATCPKGLELLLVDELRQLGVHSAAEKLAGVEFTADIAFAYKACLWSRLANKILLKLSKVPASSPEELYTSVQTIDWHQHMEPDGTLSVSFVTSHSNITHTLFGAQKVKDAIVDQFREKFNVRPDVAREQAQVNINIHLNNNVAAIYLDLSGESLHKRGYRIAGGAAPLKENLAAAILIRAGWPSIAKEGGMLLDPMCGSGTLLIEGALMAANIAPGLLRDYFGFIGWKKFQPQLWDTLLEEAAQIAEKNLPALPVIIGYDADPQAIKIAFENIERANLHGKIHVEKRELSQLVSPAKNDKPGLLIVNPPYGERLGDLEELQPLYTMIGDKLKECFPTWKAGVFTGNPDLGKEMGIRAKKYYALFNGALPCKLLLFDVSPEKFIDRSPAANNDRRIRAAQRAVEGNDMAAVQMFVNRLQKNLKHLKRKAEREGSETLRVYDADLPEYAFVIDLSEGRADVQEYEPPKTVDMHKAMRRQQEVLSVLPEALGLEPSQIFFSVILNNKKFF